MDFSQFFKNLKPTSNRDLLQSNIILSRFEGVVESENDSIQLNELEMIFEHVDLFKELYVAYSTCSNDNYEPLLECIKNIALKLDENRIPPQVYAYYISLFVSCVSEADTNFRERNDIEVIDWINPGKYDYFSFPYGKTFGISGKDKLKSLFQLKNFSIDESGTLIKYKGFSSYVVIPNHVKRIAPEAFSGNKRIKMVYIPDATGKLDAGCFKNCPNLGTVRLGNTIKTIPDSCFEGCSKLKYIIHGSIKRVGSDSFNGCENLEDESLIKEITSIGDRAFAKTSIRRVELGRCYSIGSSAFQGSKVESIVLNGVISSTGSAPFGGCKALEAIEVNVSQAFSLRKLMTVNDELDEDECPNLYSLTLNCLTPSICRGLKTVTEVSVLEKSDIPEYSFDNCVSLKKISFFDKKISNIEDYAFRNCEKLEGLDIIYLNDTLPDGAFYNCPSIRDFSFLDNVTIFKSHSLARNNLETFNFLDRRPFKFIGPFAFANSKFPDGLNILLTEATIYAGAFHGASDINVLKLDRTNIRGDLLFSIFERTIQDFVNKVHVSSLIVDFPTTPGMLEGMSVQYVECFADQGTISQASFRGCKDLETVKINGKINGFDEKAFEGCESLTYIDAEFDKEISVHDEAFKDCRNYEAPFLSSVVEFGRESFANTKITALRLDHKVSYIGQGAFAGCPIEGKVTLPFLGFDSRDTDAVFGFIFSKEPLSDTVPQTISEQEIYYIPQKISDVEVLSYYIGNHSFSGCANIQSIELPNVVDLVNSSPFKGCASLGKLKVGPLRSFNARCLSGVSPNFAFTFDASSSFEEVDGSIYSDKRSILYLYRGDIKDIPQSVKVLKSNCIQNANCEEISLSNLSSIEQNAVDLFGVKKLSLSNVASISRRAFSSANSLKDISIQSDSDIELESIIQCQRPDVVLDNLYLEHVELPSLLSIFLQADSLYSKTITLKGVEIKREYLALVKADTLNAISLRGKGLIDGDVNGLVFEGEQSLSDTFEFLDNGCVVQNVKVSCDCVESNDLDGLIAKSVELVVPGSIVGNSFDNAKVETVKFIGTSFIDPSILVNTSFLYQFENSRYLAFDSLVFEDGELIYGRPEQETFTITSELGYLRTGSLDLRNVSHLIVSDENCQFEAGAIIAGDKLSKISCPALSTGRLTSIFNNLDSIQEIQFLGEVVPSHFLSGFPNLKVISLDEKTERLNDFAFAHNPNLVAIHGFQHPLYYGDFLCYDCQSLVGLEFNPAAELIGVGIGEGCSSLKHASLPLTDNHLKSNIKFSDILDVNPLLIVNVSSLRFPSHFFEDSEARIVSYLNPQYIGASCFKNCKDVVIDLSNAREISEEAFANSGYNSKKTDLSGCLTIGSGAFRNTTIGSLTISSNLKLFDISSFENSNITSIEMVGEGGIYREENECIIENGKLIFSLPKISGDISFSDNVTSIADGVFAKCESLNAVNFPNVDKIEGTPFVDCPSLTSVSLPKLVSIEGTLFNGCNSLRSLVIGSISTPEKEMKLTDLFGIEDEEQALKSLLYVKITGDYLGPKDFVCDNNVKAVDIVGNVTSIPKGYFILNQSLEKVFLPNFCSSIGDFAFMKCSKLKEININAKQIGEKAFEGTALSCIHFENDVTRIGGDAFKDAPITDVVFEGDVGYFSSKRIGISPSKLKAVKFSKGVALEESSFEGYESLEKVEAVSIEGLPDRCFANCRNLKSISGLSDCLTIGRESLMNCEKLDLQIHRCTKLESIGDRAFAGTSFESVTVPSCVKKMGTAIFDRCDKLTTVDFDNEIAVFDRSIISSSNESSNIANITLKRAESLKEGCFENCHCLRSVNLSNSIKEIPDRCFKKCTHLAFIDGIGSCVSIGEEAFADTNIASLTLPNNVKNVKAKAFYGNKNLKQVEIDVTKGISIGDYAFANTAIQKLVAKNVKSLGIAPFEGCPITTFTLENTKESLSKLLLGVDVSKITSVRLGVPSLEASCFSGFSSLEKVSLESSSLISIPESAFEGCEVLEEVLIPDSLVSISDRAFYGCRNLFLHANFFDHIKTIGKHSFASCSSITHVYLDSAVSIGDGSFMDCWKLKSVSTSNLLEAIPCSCFEGCTKLGTVQLKKGLKEIGNNAFSNTKVSSLAIPETCLKVGKSIFAGNKQSVKVLVPKKMKRKNWDSDWDKGFSTKKILFWDVHFKVTVKEV